MFRLLRLLLCALLLLAVAWVLWTETSDTPGERAFRARGCVLCHPSAFADELLEPLRRWQPGQPVTAPVRERVAAAHPRLSAGAERDLADFLVERQRPLLAASHARNEGERLFIAKCAACHGRDGAGQPGSYPPLLGSEWLTEPEKSARLPEILTQGLQGPITVKGEAWDATMNAPGLGGAEQVQAVIDYLRTRFAP